MAETNRTEKATPKKRRDERKKGNSFQSKDVISIVVLLLGFYAIRRMGGFIAKQTEQQFVSLMSRAIRNPGLSIPLCVEIFGDMVKAYMLSAMPIVLACMTAGVLVTGIQTRFLVSGELIKFKGNRISLIAGIKRMVSLRSTVQLLKSMLEIAVIIWVITTGVRDMLPVVPDILNVDIGTSLAFMMNRTTAMVYKICLFFVAVAVMDFGYQRYEYEQKLMMTKQEIKDEYKQMEGDPLIRSRIRERQRKLSLNRMLQQVPEADVVVRNPTHYADALKYRAEEDAAPLVVAKGQDSLARRILDVAEKNGVLIAENKPLAQSLYRNVDVNEYIPEDFFRPVAEILAWVYRQRKERRRA